MKMFSKVALLSGLVFLTTAQALAISINFANYPGAQVVFTGTGDSFAFETTQPAGHDFWITGSNGDGTSLALFGSMEGTFTIGSIVTDGSKQYAPVSGAGTVSIADKLGSVWSANLVWDTIQTDGTGGTINVEGTLNLSGIDYSGANTDLLALSQNSVGSESVTFQFIPGKSLTELTTDGAVNKTSYSGVITVIAVPDGGASVLLIGATLFAMGALRRSR